MKRLGLGFAAIIAVLTMSFTVASHEGAFTKPTEVAQGCWRDISNSSLPSVTRTANPTPVSPAFQLNIAATGSTLRANPAAGCNGDDLICCYQVNSSNQVVEVYYGNYVEQ